MIRALLRFLTATTLAAGFIGLLRQRHESQAVRRGERPRPSAAGEVELQTRYSGLAERLATWVPTRPHSTFGRRLTFMWASPLTLMGWLVAATSGRPPRWDEERGCFLAQDVGGASRLALRGVGAHANAIGQVVLCTVPDPSLALLAHETVHVRQAERLGPLLFPVYVWLGARYGYADHPLERAARAGARMMASEGPGQGNG